MEAPLLSNNGDIGDELPILPSTPADSDEGIAHQNYTLFRPEEQRD